MRDLVSALSQFHIDVGKIVKGSKAQYGLYADLATVLATVTPSLAANGLIVTQTFSPWDGGYTILRTTLAHVSGDSITSDVLMPREESARNQLHSFGAACTYLRRYALLAILNLAAEDDDGESFGNGSKPLAKTASSSKPRTKAFPPEPTQPVNASAPNADDLSPDERSEVINLVKGLSESARNELVDAFRQQFSIAAGIPVSDYIRTLEHALFIRSHLDGAAVAS